jgi:hypothetical protein
MRVFLTQLDLEKLNTMIPLETQEKEKLGEKTHLKEFLMRVYFKEHTGTALDNLRFLIRFKDRTILGMRLLPKRFYRRYELVMFDIKNKRSFRRPISYGEKDALKIFVEQVNR